MFVVCARKKLSIGLISFFALLLLTSGLYVIEWLPVQAVAQSPVPASPVIADLSWAPVSTIRRAATDSDNWPVTWGADDNLYTAYGDGHGFQHAAPEKLSLGFARVSGGPTDFVGTNIPSPDQQTGQGRLGKKASGILMVEGVLYIWVRNANNNGEECQIAQSTDNGENWSWSGWTFAQFGYCTFLNYGQNYAGARDNYVYMYSHDHPNAYTGTEDYILTRVSKDQIMERAAYEFFVGTDGENNSTWSSEISERGAVFSYTEDRARRSGITYNAAIGRYLWWHGFPGSQDERYEGGFAVYDAPEPWGPWTTVYHTEAWDVGPGETASFPTKWMSADGTEIYLVFSGDDAFSVRKATLTLNGNPPPETPTSRPGQSTLEPTDPAPTDPATTQRIEVRVSSGTDDVEEQDGRTDLSSGDLEMVENQKRPQLVGIRFQDVQIPPGATIQRAVIRFRADSSESKATSLLFHGDSSSNAISFTNQNVESRSRTNASVPWNNVPVWSKGQPYESPELAPIMQEMVSSGNWSSGNNLAFIVSGSGKRSATSYNGGSSNAPLLIIDFTTGDAPASTPTPVPTPVPTDVPTEVPTDVPTDVPTEVPTSTPTNTPVSPTPVSPTPVPPTEVPPTETATPTPPISPEPTAPANQGHIEVRIANGADDVEEQDGRVDERSGDLEMSENQGRLQLVGMRFQNVQIPANATVTRAFIRFTADSSQSGAASLRFHGEDSDDAASISNSNNLAGRARTTANVAWNNVSAWSNGQVVDSPDLATLVQAIVDRGGWSSGNDLVFIVSGTGKRAATSFNGGASRAPLFVVEFTTGGENPPVATNTPAVPQATATAIPPTEVPPTEIPPTEIPPTEIPPTPVPPTATPLPTVSMGEQRIEVRISTGVDDVEEQNGRVDAGSGDLEMVENRSQPQLVGMRFQNVAIPDKATITRAVVRFTADSSENKATSLLFQADASDDAVSISNNANLANRSRTAASVSWNDVPAWSGGQLVDSPDLASIVQEIVNRGGWRSGNNMVFIVSGSGKRAATSYNGGSISAPLLVVEYTVGAAVNAAQVEHAGVNPSDTGGVQRPIYLPVILQ